MVNPIAAVGSTVAALVVAGGTGVVIWYFFFRKKPKFTFTDPAVKVPLRIVDRQPASHDTIRLKLALPSTEHRPGIPVGKHVYFVARIEGQTVVRPYTPVSLDTQKGYMDFVIKVYKANTNPNFPRGGKMSQYLMNIPRDQYIDVRGPSGNLHYKGLGVFDIKPDEASPAQKYTAKFVNMICGGSGITPMFQLLSYILSNDKDMTRLSLVFANNSEGDILLRDELDAYTTKFPNQLRVWYVVKEPPANWRYSSGYVSESVLSEHLYPPGNDTLVLLCGPTPMVEFACYPNLAKLNYARNRIFAY
ncbi:hypothetical protein CRM22_001111 [Opisthorchis felineus]|uniref:NADH-cytochrome b5 reductase n=1 Tax=Opisthorchis felineus TaxID=147828 RepID=A0A4S2MG95_OPIFE|nr:hypothetical protein CRM22_001111 [Opisthorchis felineus]